MIPEKTPTRMKPNAMIPNVRHQRPLTSPNERRSALRPRSPSTSSAGIANAHAT